jgi:hypothetical protein
MPSFAGVVAFSAGLLALASCTTETIRMVQSRDAGVRDSHEADPPATCSADVPDACPSTVPSYRSDVVPIFEAKCNGCHMGGEGGPWPLTNYFDVLHWRAQVLSELARCTMPPSTSQIRVTEPERATLIAWLVCGAPNN